MKFLQGERKEVGIRIVSRKNEEFVIRNALYEFKKFGSNLIEANGEALIKTKEISTFIQPYEKGLYTLTFTYEIALETLKAEVQVEVR